MYALWGSWLDFMSSDVISMMLLNEISRETRIGGLTVVLVSVWAPAFLFVPRALTRKEMRLEGKGGADCFWVACDHFKQAETPAHKLQQ